MNVLIMLGAGLIGGGIAFVIKGLTGDSETRTQKDTPSTKVQPEKPEPAPKPEPEPAPEAPKPQQPEEPQE